MENSFECTNTCKINDFLCIKDKCSDAYLSGYRALPLTQPSTRGTMDEGVSKSTWTVLESDSHVPTLITFGPIKFK